MNYMAEQLLNIFEKGNRQGIAEIFLIISISYIAVIIIIVYIGQRTRIISPLTKSKIICRQTTGCEAVFTKRKTDPENIRYSKILKKKLV
jgi:hypothetical protein